jgi:hypothetical protein
MAQVQETLEEQQEAMPATDPAYEAWFRRKVERSIIAADAGQLLSGQEVDERAEARIRQALEQRGALG